MTDLVDQANDLAERERESLIARRVALATAPGNPADLADCLDCGGEVDPRRRAALPRVDRCIDCATRFELEIRQGRPA